MAESTDEVLHELSYVVSEKKNKATITLSKTNRQLKDLKDHDLKDYDVTRKYNRETKTISIRVTIRMKDGSDKLYGKDIEIPTHGEIDADKTLNKDMDIGKNSIEFKVYKINEFSFGGVSAK